MPQERHHVVRPKMSLMFLKRSGTGKSYLRIRKKGILKGISIALTISTPCNGCNAICLLEKHRTLFQIERKGVIPMPQWNLREFMSLMRMLDCARGLLEAGFT